MPAPLDTAAHIRPALAAGTLALATASLARGAARQGHARSLPAGILVAATAALAVPIGFSAFSRTGSYAWLGGLVGATALLASLWRRRERNPGVLQIGLGDRALDAAALPVAAAMVLCGAAILFEVPANHDLAWLMYVGGRVLDGARPYRDLIEVNPPLVIYLSAAAAWVGRRLSVTSFTAFYGLVLVLAGLSAGLCSWLLARLAPVGVTRWAAAVFLFLVVPFAGVEFGQREHLLLLLYAPYLVLAALRARRQPIPWPAAVGIALAAAIGVSIKPYFVLPWLLTEGYVAARAGLRPWLRRPDPWVVLATGAIYLAIVLLRLPEYVHLAAWGAQLYVTFGSGPLPSILVTPRTLLIGLALLVAFAVQGSDGLRDVRRLLALASVGLLLALVWQRKGWDYHWYPVLACGLLSLALLAIEATRGAAHRLAATLAMVTVCSASAVTRVADPVRRAEAELYPSQLSRMKAVVREYAAGGPILVLSTQVGAAFPLVNYAGLEWASRFNCLWFVPGLYPELGADTATEFPYHPVARMAPAERWVLRAYAADVRARKPTLILVDSFEPDSRLRRFDPLTFLMRDSSFAAERRHYRKLGWVGRYLVLRRADLPAPLAGAPAAKAQP